MPAKSANVLAELRRLANLINVAGMALHVRGAGRHSVARKTCRGWP